MAHIQTAAVYLSTSWKLIQIFQSVQVTANNRQRIANRNENIIVVLDKIQIDLPPTPTLIERMFSFWCWASDAPLLLQEMLRCRVAKLF